MKMALKWISTCTRAHMKDSSHAMNLAKSKGENGKCIEYEILAKLMADHANRTDI